MVDDSPISGSRRAFLRSAALLGGGALLAGCGGETPESPAPAAPPTPAPPAPPVDPLARHRLDGSLFHLHSQSPLTLEAKRGSLGIAPITPMSRFFVRNNLPMPSPSILADRDGWQLEVAGVAKAGTLSLAWLKQLPFTTVTTVLQCSGNGRKYYEHGPSGSQWGVGAAGCAMWTGVTVRSVVEALGGVVDGAKYLTSTGGETLPEGVDPLDVVVERSIPRDKALLDCVLAWEMNGEPIPLTHGGPLRLIVPGFYGCNQIKYVRRIAFTEAQTEAKIQRSGYRLRDIGQRGSPDQPSMWQMNVKSWVIGPGADGADVLAGSVPFHGVAFAGGSPIAKVECSLDGGATWAEAELVGPDLGPYAWRTFRFVAELEPGTHQIVSRATAVDGSTQPDARRENERGYGNNSWRDMVLELTTVAERSVPTVPATDTPETAATAAPGPKPKVALDAQAERGKAAVLSEVNPPCGACHTLDDAGIGGAVGPNLDELAPDAARVEAAVTNGVGVMPAYKGTLDESLISDIAHYVATVTCTP
ncbi:MAG: molybdopterin-dependent oxidoreductase [Deltaproteobacteria bacterium]|nr:molybdopterin-dependent oxidoreductase [Deltaproteobacteria bacterium]